MSLVLNVQKAVFDALTSALSQTVHDGEAPTDAALPFVVIDSVQEIPDETLKRERAVATVYMTVWSAYSGNAQALGIAETIRTTLDHARLTLASGTMIRGYVRSISTERDIASGLRKAVLTTRILAQR